MDWFDLLQWALRAVVSAFAVAFAWWLFNRLTSRPPLRWKTVARSRFADHNLVENQTLYVVSVEFKNATSSVIDHLDIFMNGAILDFQVSRKLDASLVDGKKNSLRIEGIQPKSRAVVSILSNEVLFDVERVQVDRMQLNQSEKV